MASNTQMQFNVSAPPMVADNRPLPQAVQAERALVGAAILDNSIVKRMDVSYLEDRHFHDLNMSTVWAAIVAMTDEGKAVTPITLKAHLGDDVVAAIGGAETIIGLSVAAESLTAVSEYAEAIWKTWSLRDQIARTLKATQLLYETAVSNFDANMGQIKADLVGPEDFGPYSEGGFVPIGQEVQAEIDRLGEVYQNPDSLDMIGTGFASLDAMLGGFAPSELVVLAARPSMGKSAFSLGMALKAASEGHVAGFVSLEMSGSQLTRRTLSQFSKIDSFRLKMGSIVESEWTPIMEAANNVANLPLFISTPENTRNCSAFETIKQNAIIQKAKYGLDILFIDYLQLMRYDIKGNNHNRTAELAEITRGLKLLAIELDIPIVLLSQLNRSLESRMDKRPMLADLRQSGSIEEDANSVLFLYREDYYVPDTDRQNIADVIVAKSRDGATATISLYFRKELTEFSDLEIERVDLDDYTAKPNRPRYDAPAEYPERTMAAQGGVDDEGVQVF